MESARQVERRQEFERGRRSCSCRPLQFPTRSKCMRDDRRSNDSIDGKLERAKDAALGSHHGHPTVADQIGEGVGGMSGVLLGAGIGSAAGPVGALIGGIAGAIGGWWAGRAVVEAASSLSQEDEAYFREHYDNVPNRAADRAYDDVRPAYYLGQIASHNPNFLERE